jgi:hypothetical protein
MTNPNFDAQADEPISLLQLRVGCRGAIASALRDAYVAGREGAGLLGGEASQGREVKRTADDWADDVEIVVDRVGDPRDPQNYVNADATREMMEGP